MTGIWVERRRKGLSAAKLAAMVGVTPASIRKWEREIPPRLSAQHLIALADALDVLIDDLVKTYNDVLTPNEDRVPYECKVPPGNCIEIYRRRKMLSYRQLADRMGVSTKQGASQICRAKKPSPKYLARLAALEGVSPTKFEVLYAIEKGDV